MLTMQVFTRIDFFPVIHYLVNPMHAKNAMTTIMSDNYSISYRKHGYQYESESTEIISDLTKNTSTNS